MPLADFASWISLEAGISVVVADDLDSRAVTLDAVDLPVSDLMTAVARRVGAQVNRLGNLYLIGDLRPEDRALFVAKVGQVDSQTLQDMVSTLLSENGQLTASQEGLLVVADRVEVIGQVSLLVSQIKNASPDTWCCSFYVVDVFDEYALDLGGDPVPTIVLSATFADGSSGISKSWLAAAAFDTKLTALQVDGRLDVTAKPMMLLVSGITSTWANQVNQPYRTKTVTDQGVIVDDGIEYLQIGDLLTVKISDLERGQALLEYSWTSSRILDTTSEGLPVDRRITHSSRAAVNSGGLYLLASFDLQEDQRNTTGIIPLHFEKAKRSRRVEIWATVYRIAPLADTPARIPDGDRTGEAPACHAQ